MCARAVAIVGGGDGHAKALLLARTQNATDGVISAPLPDGLVELYRAGAEAPAVIWGRAEAPCLSRCVYAGRPRLLDGLGYGLFFDTSYNIILII